MPHSRLAPVILGTVLAASLTPAHASATDGQPADTTALATAQAGGDSVKTLQNTAADTAVEDAEGDSDGNQSGADKPGAGDDLLGEDSGNGSGSDAAGDESTAPDAGAQPDGNAVDQTTGDGQATDVAARTLTATGDTSLLAGGIAALGSAAAFIGTAIAQRLRKS